jgi:hypothetical protein
MLARDDFAGYWRQDWRGDSSKAAAPPTSSGTRRSEKSDKSTAAPAAAEAPTTRTVRRNKDTHIFPYHLKDVLDAGERERQVRSFLSLTMLDWKCNQCGMQGHTKELCPRSFQLDANLFERNSKSFFFGLRPQPQVLSLRTPVKDTAKVMPVLEALEPPLSSLGVQTTELDPEELQAFRAWKAGPVSRETKGPVQPRDPAPRPSH